MPGASAAEGIYLEDDFVTNLLATVVDFQMNTTAVVRAIEHYKAHRWDEVRTIADFRRTLACFRDT